MNENRYGIFISYKRSHVHLAGRIYDFFKAKGIDPFMDLYSLPQRKNYKRDIKAAIDASPYFLCLLSEDGLTNLKAEEEVADEDKMTFSQEVLYALEREKEIRILLYGDISASDLESLPEKYRILSDINVSRSKIKDEDFCDKMDQFYHENINIEHLKGIIDWHEYIAGNSNTLILPRDELHTKYATMDNRFGHDFMSCIDNKTEFNGENRVAEINMICYAASLQVAPDQNMVDRRAFDNGRMFNTFSELLKDPAFSLCIITTMPDCAAVQDAIRYQKLGNSALEDNLEAVFYGSFGKLSSLSKQEPYRSALKNKRFKFRMTECALPYALFQIIYKDKWKQFNHIKADLYSYRIDSSAYGGVLDHPQRK